MQPGDYFHFIDLTGLVPESRHSEVAHIARSPFDSRRANLVEKTWLKQQGCK